MVIFNLVKIVKYVIFKFVFLVLIMKQTLYSATMSKVVRAPLDDVDEELSTAALPKNCRLPKFNQV